MNRPEIDAILRAAADMQRAGRRDQAVRLYHDLLDRHGEHPIALNALGVQALASADFGVAADLFARAIAVDPKAVDLWLNLATAHRRVADLAGEQAALEGALALDQRHFMALVRMAELLERSGSHALAAERWSGVLAMAPMIDERTPALDAMLEHARDFVARQRSQFAEAIDAGLADLREARQPEELRRFDACIDHLVGRRQIYANVCAGLHVPFLPADEFFDRRHFAWLDRLEQATETIRDELTSLLGGVDTGFAPYVAMEPGLPVNKWTPLDNRMDWSALHLWRDGVRNDAACARCPVTASLVEALPLARIPGRAPTVFFSLLQPGTHLPAHTGVSNMRTIIHLPLVVPEGCAFRVGGETREWRVGEAWAFDDTIEHEAWNRSQELRAILIFDVWNPHLTKTEQDLLCAFFPLADRNGYSASGGSDR